jgi:hypothetical protein
VLEIEAFEYLYTSTVVLDGLIEVALLLVDVANVV